MCGMSMTQGAPTSPSGAIAGEDAGLAAALSQVGDRWSLLIVSSLLDGPLRFTELVRAVEGIAPNILAERLRRLARAGVVIAEPYSRRPPRHEYRLTEEGHELGGFLRLLAAWGDPRPGHAGVHHAACGTSVEARWYCPTCARLLGDEEGSDLVHL